MAQFSSAQDQAATQQRSGVPSSTPIHFTDVTAQSGIDFTMTCGGTPSTEILEVNGGGLGLIDYDNDGKLDLFITNGAALADPEHGPGCRLYRNLGPPSLKFQDVTAAAGIDIHRWAMGVAVGDYDGDGFDDIYITCYGPNILLHNDGHGHFVDVTTEALGTRHQALVPRASMPNASPFPSWSTSAAFGDVDGDGDLDLFVCNYLDFDVEHPPPHAMYKGVEVMAGPHGLHPQQPVLYQNMGDGTFRDVSERALGDRLLAVSSQPSADSRQPKAFSAFGLNVVIIDMDRDGKQDIIVSNDSMPDFYFHNLGKGIEASRHQGNDPSSPASMPNASMPDASIPLPRFEEIGEISGIAVNADGTNQSSMGIAIADVDGNGFPDKFITVFSSDTNSLHMNTDGRLFEDRSQQYGLAMISRPYLGWGCGFYDFDHDGDEDLFMVNGHVYPQATLESMDSEYQQTPLLFERKGKRFARVLPETAGAWLAQKHRDRNVVFADLDGDGDIDMIIGELNGPIRVLRNDLLGGDSPSTGKDWLIVELKDERPAKVCKNHRGLGSRIELTAQSAAGPIKQTRWLFTGGGFQSSGAPYVHFGLGGGLTNCSLRVFWPDGFEQAIENVALNQHLIVKRTPQDQPSATGTAPSH